jgi:E3 ubiquitin-protein ligase FANCL
MNSNLSLLLPNASFCEWSGVLLDRFLIRLVVPREVARASASVRDSAARLPVSLSGSRFDCDAVLLELLQRHNCTKLLEQRLAASFAIDAFLLELSEIVRPLLLLSAGADPMQPALLTASCSRLLSELDAIGWANVAHVGAKLDDVHLRVVDAAQRTHVLQFQLPADYPRSPPIVRGDLPSAIELRWRGAHSTLRDALQQCAEFVAQFQSVWHALDAFDAQCLVLEPPMPAARGVLARRIALGAHRTLSLVLDWQRPLAVPRECLLLGPEAAVAPLRERLAGGLHRWNASAPLADNLAAILEIELPSPVTHARADFAIECGICYAVRRAATSGIADTVCNNERCGRPFHEACLFEWLRSIPSNTLTFDVIFGTCPYCSAKISARRAKE